MAVNTTAYYDATADGYESLHGDDPTHIRALEVTWPLVEAVKPRSVLDVGCGTGLALRWIAKACPNANLFGVDPSRKLLERASSNLPGAALEVGNGERLKFADKSVDVVVATGIMHHVDHPSAVIDEMLRVARKAVLISDHNNFAFGGIRAQRARMLLYCLGLLGLATYLKQGFKRQGYSEDDGWWYPYSLFDNFAQISDQSETVHLIPTRRATPGLGGNMLFCQSHFVLLAIKRT